MIPRMTTVGVLNNYRYDLNKSNNTLYKAMNTVMTGRSFNSYAEDPAVATRCFQIRRSYQRTVSQLTVNTSLVGKYNQAWSCLDTVSQDIYDSTVTQNSTAFGSLLRSENGADASGRNALGQSLSALAKSIVQTMNGRNGENYVFGGSETLNPPFTWGPNENLNYVPDLDKAEAKVKEIYDEWVKGGRVPASGPDYGKWGMACQYLREVKIDTGEKDEAGNPIYEYDYVPTTDKDGAAYDTIYEINAWYDPESTVDEATARKKIEEIFEKYKNEDGTYNGSLAREDPEYAKYAAPFKYLDDDGIPTNNTDEPEPGKDYDLGARPAKRLDSVKMLNPGYDPVTGYKYVKEDDTGTNVESEAGNALYFRGVRVDSMDELDRQKMEYFLNGEKKYQDVGLGHKEQEGNEAIASTVFDSALQGIYYLSGYGTDENGIPNNLISIIDRLGTILQRCDPDNGSYASDKDAAEAELLAHKLEDQQSLFVQRYAELDTQSSFLRDNGELLTDTADSLAEDFMALEDVDPADAITAYMYARYCYDAALKLGNSVLPTTLMDYMNL